MKNLYNSSSTKAQDLKNRFVYQEKPQETFNAVKSTVKSNPAEDNIGKDITNMELEETKKPTIPQNVTDKINDWKSSPNYDVEITDIKTYITESPKLDSGGNQIPGTSERTQVTIVTGARKPKGSGDAGKKFSQKFYKAVK